MMNENDSPKSVFKPFVPDSDTRQEFTVRAVLLGAFLGVVFAASSVYLALKVGMTVSASIPIAVLSITLFRLMGRATILENNIVQTTGSAGESIAFGVAITAPVFLLLGEEMNFMVILLLALLGGIMGVLMMIPLRKGLIVKEHGKLTYPEGTACAEVLIAGEQGGAHARTVFMGFAFGAVYKFLNAGLKLWSDIPARMLTFYKGGSVAAEVTPELLGVGYIIGSKIAANMFAGGVVSYLILIPAIKIFGEGLNSAMFPASKLIREMSPGEIRNAYVLYMGAGAVATGGLISLVRSVPTIASAFRRGFQSILESRTEALAANAVPRTDRDLSMPIVLFGSLGLVLAIWLAPQLRINAVSAVLILLFGFFFVTVSSRITGEIGSSSNPISGMAVATLLITCLLFLAAGWTGVSYRSMALSTAAIVCIAAAVAGATSQDLKTGFLVGATPKHQQVGIMVGVVTSALFIGLTVIALNKAYTTVVPAQFPQYTATVPVDAKQMTGPDGATYRIHRVTEPDGIVLVGRYLVDDAGRIRYLVDPGIAGVVTEVDGKHVTKLDSPKARLFSLIIDGILTRKLPWGLVLIGVFLALTMEVLGISSLPFAVGLYLPLSSSAPIMAGGIIRLLVERKIHSAEVEAETDFPPGVLMSSGLIAGAAIMGVVLAILTGFGIDRQLDLSGISGSLATADWFAVIPFVMLMYVLYGVGVSGTGIKGNHEA
ncbi:MAG TPA: oligopeptide transporter, OPT family [Dongiaceae bacterium]|nr:oligopeptide transporter, OPT family [Dongiaceae bacterium]